MDKLSLPNALSAARLLLAPLVAASLLEGCATIALTLFLVAIATDLADGYLARTWDQTSAFGGLLDHTSDAVFIATTLAVLSLQQYVNWLLAPLVLISFAQYAIDSRVLEGHPLRGSQIGRYNGLAYFFLAGFPIIQEGLDFRPIPYDWVQWLAWLLVATTLLSMANRLVAYLRLRSNISE